ncbi:uncharacterized protein [Acropora muricata]|uniref:uncharacterized protein n=1 Tax=Acropora muricata TaxID=159855 RepID=UPI0034E5D52B
MTIANMSSKPQNTITDQLQQDFRALYIKILSDLEKDQSKELRYFYFGTPETYDLLSIEDAGKISWTDVSSLKEGLSAVGRQDLVETLEEFELKTNLALLLHAFVTIRKGIPRQNLFQYIEAIAVRLANSTDDALDKNKFKVRSLRKSKKSIEEVMISLKEKIETNLSEPWTKKLALLTVIAGELLSETDFAMSLPKAVLRCSAEICSAMASLDEWDKFCLYVEERYNTVYHKDDHIDRKNIADDIIDTLIQTPFFHEPGNTL